MHLKNRIPADSTQDDLRAMDRMPKSVIYAIAKHLISLSSESYDQSIDDGSYIDRFAEEWGQLHRAGIIPQKPRNLRK